MKRFNLMITEEMHATIQKSAERRGLTMNAVVIVALESYFFQQETVDTISTLQRQLELQQLGMVETDPEENTKHD